jgi:hypothetical protein
MGLRIQLARLMLDTSVLYSMETFSWANNSELIFQDHLWKTPRNLVLLSWRDGTAVIEESEADPEFGCLITPKDFLVSVKERKHWY